MSEYPQPGIHPDADSLSAFAEGVLPEHERLACVAHVAECARCREIVWLSQPAIAEKPALVTERPVRFWKRWFVPAPALAAAAVACVLVVSIAFYRQHRRDVPGPELTADVRTPAVAPVVPETTQQPLASAPAKTVPRAKVRVERESDSLAESAAAPAVAASPVAAPPPPPPPAPAAAPAIAGFRAVDAVSGVAGTITDPAGGALPNARVNLFDDATGKSFTSATDTRGQFSIAGMAPGRYQMNIVSPGFKQMSQQVDVQPQQMARLDSRLEVGAATETVTVSAESSLLKTESGELSHDVKTAAADALPVRATAGRSVSAGLAPTASTASKEKIRLTVDSSGALLFSKDAGKTWKAIKGKWQGKVVSLKTTPDPAHAAQLLFQLTTDSAAVWLSRDGSHWYPAPARP